MFKPQPGETYRLQAGDHYDQRITITAVNATTFTTDEPHTYILEDFRQWMTRRSVTATKEETR